ncbi:MAG: hypothetical protein QOH92_692 [Chloroflexota bacterium]|jgi:hypothetical protein|nr:hypothetical protein [Chloroflexota bacterium]
MRRVPLAAAAVGTGTLIATLFGGHALAGQIGLSATFPASRIQVDTAPTTLKMPGPTTVTAIVEDWHGATIPKVPVSFAILSGPNKGKPLSAATTNKDGRATLTYSNSGEPGIDAIQASFTDGLEVHKSNRHFVLWLSGPPATAIRSPATIRVTPTCFQPAAAVVAASNTFKKVAPRTTPKPSAGASRGPQPEKTTANVTGDNFNPFSAVLITFDAGPGGSPQSFEAQTDVFGHFSRDIPLIMPAEGLHLVRVDDFRQREADATFAIPCFQPSVALDPPIGPPGFVTIVVGSGFPANSTIVVLNWQPPALLSPLPAVIKTDSNGAFQFPLLVLYHDLLGPRLMQAIVANPFGDRAGAAIEADAPFLVTPGRAQPSDFVLRR